MSDQSKFLQVCRSGRISACALLWCSSTVIWLGLLHWWVLGGTWSAGTFVLRWVLTMITVELLVCFTKHTLLEHVAPLTIQVHCQRNEDPSVCKEDINAFMYSEGGMVVWMLRYITSDNSSLIQASNSQSFRARMLISWLPVALFWR